MRQNAALICSAPRAALEVEPTAAAAFQAAVPGAAALVAVVGAVEKAADGRVAAARAAMEVAPLAPAGEEVGEAADSTEMEVGAREAVEEVEVVMREAELKEDPLESEAFPVAVVVVAEAMVVAALAD